MSYLPFQTMHQRVASQVAQRRLVMLLIACFAPVAVILSAVGVYGVLLAWILITVVALVASTVPASNAARTDLISVLHSE